MNVKNMIGIKAFKRENFGKQSFLKRCAFSRNALWTFCSLSILSCGSFTDPPLPGVRYTLNGEMVSEGGISQKYLTSKSAFSSAQRGDWSQHGRNATHQVGNIGFDGAPNFVALVETGKGARNAVEGGALPIIAGNKIFHYDAAGVARAVDFAGNVLWEKDLTPIAEKKGDGYGGGLAVRGSNLYVSTGYGEVLALNANNGEIFWRAPQGASKTRNAPLLLNNILVVNSGLEAIAFDLKTGAVKWRHVGGLGRLASRIDGGVPTSNGSLVAIPYATGSLAMVNAIGHELWKIGSVSDVFTASKSPLADISGDPIFDGQNIILSTLAGVASFSSTGQLNWHLDIPIRGSLQLSGNELVGISQKGELIRIHKNSGKLTAQVLLKKTINGDKARKLVFREPRLVNGQIWTADNKGNMHVFDASNGMKIALYDLPGKLAHTPIFGNGVMAVTDQKGRLLIFR